MFVPGGIASRSSTAPLSASTWRSSLSSPSHVPCHSSPSTKLTPVTKRFDSIVRRIGARLRIDLQDLAIAILPDPQAALGPRQTRVAALAGRGDRREHVARLRIDLVDARLGDLVEMRAVERGAGVAGAVERARELAALGIERDQLGARGGPHVAAVVRDAVDLARRRRTGRTRARSRPRAVLPRSSSVECVSCRFSFAALVGWPRGNNLAVRQRSRE